MRQKSGIDFQYGQHHHLIIQLVKLMHPVWLHRVRFPIMLQDLQARGQIREVLVLVGRQ